MGMGYCGRKYGQGHPGSFGLLGRQHMIRSVTRDPRNDEEILCVSRKVSYWHKFSVRNADLLSYKISTLSSLGPQKEQCGHTQDTGRKSGRLVPPRVGDVKRLLLHHPLSHLAKSISVSLSPAKDVMAPELCGVMSDFKAPLHWEAPEGPREGWHDGEFRRCWTHGPSVAGELIRWKWESLPRLFMEKFPIQYSLSLFF